MPDKKRADVDLGGRPRQTPEPDGLFQEWIGDSGKSVAEVAEDLDIAGSTVYALREGAFRPSLKLAAKIEKYTLGAVPALSWLG